MYCAVHQEMRELALRGVDGPGLHILDVVPESYAKAPGGPEAAAARKVLVDKMLQRAPVMFKSRPKRDRNGVIQTAEDVKDGTMFALRGAAGALMMREDSDSSSGSGAFGWQNYNTCAPLVQEMSRGMTQGLERTQSLPNLEAAEEGEAGKVELSGEERKSSLGRCWSIAY